MSSFVSFFSAAVCQVEFGIFYFEITLQVMLQYKTF